MNSPVNLNTYLGGIPVGLMVIDKNGFAVDHNDLALKLLNIRVEDLLTHPVHALLSPPELADMIRRISLRTMNAEGIVVKKGDSHIRCYTTPSGEQQDTTTLVVGDATDSYRMQKMEQEFLGTILHGLRNPLTTLKISLGLLTEQDNLSSPQVGEIIEMSTRETNRLHSYLTDLRHAFLIETGEALRELRPESFRVSELLISVRKATQQSSSFVRDTESRIVLEEIQDYSIHADFEYAKTAVEAILKNALIYSDQDQPVHVSTSPSGTSICIEIRDQGIGIRPENAPLIYKKFFREDNEFTRENSGNGLGLFLAHSFLTLIGGSVYCECEPNEGSTFFVSLPRS